MVERLEHRITMLSPQLAPQPREGGKPWQKTALSPKRVTGRALQARNTRIKTRDQWTCKACGRITTHLDVDHVVPLYRGGSDDDDNLQSLCAGKGQCHEQKTLRERSC